MCAYKRNTIVYFIDRPYLSGSMNDQTVRHSPNTPSIAGLAAVAAVALVLAACAPAPRISSPSTPLPPHFEAGAPPVTPATAAKLDDWWIAFGDSQLTRLIDRSLLASTTSRLAFARLQEARATRTVTRAGTLPSGSLTGSVTEQGTRRAWGGGATTPGQESYALNFYPSWEIDLFGRLGAIREQADTVSAASTFDFQAVRLALAADVANALFQARGLALDLETAIETRDITEQLSRAARIGEQRGISSGQDLARLEADAASAAAEATRLTGELQAAKRSLLILVGDPDAATATLDIAPDLAMPPDLPPVTPGILLARRPDVLSAQLSLQSAILGARIDRLALFPSFTIQPGLGLTGTGGPATAGIGIWSIAAGIGLPILDRTRLMAQYRLSQARGEEAVVTYEKAVQTAFGEAENALVRLDAAKARMPDLERANARSGAAFASATRGYRAGLTDLTTLIQTQRTWLQARAARNNGRLALLTGTVAAVRALGGGWSPTRPNASTADGTR